MTELDTARACAEKMYAVDRASRELGITVEIPEARSATASMDVTDRMINGFDVCHGGLIFTLADTAFAFACNATDDMTVAAAGSIEFLRPARPGDRLVARARERQRGRRSGIYDVEVRNQSDELVALFRGRAAVLGQPVPES